MLQQLRFFLTILALIYGSCAWTQNKVNYSDIKKQIKHFKCYDTYLDSVNLTLKCLLAIDTLTLSTGLDDYYYDLGMTYYVKSEMYEQTDFLQLNNIKL